MNNIIRKLLERISDFEFKNVLFFLGIVLLIYLVTGCMLDSIQESRARAEPFIVESK